MSPTPSVLEEQLASSAYKTVGWPWRLLLLGFVVFGISVAVYAVLLFGVGPYLDAQIAGYDDELALIDQEIGDEEREQLISFYSQVVHVRSLLDTRSKASAFVAELESLTHQFVLYETFTFNVLTGSVEISAVAPSYEIAAQQMKLYEQSDMIEGVSLKSITYDTEAQRTEFGFSLTLASL